ncbi:peptidoglycan editing factor PgeF [Roseomonas sp. PWR1]|uniref:Purine nucleoside phosphorylase n=1 Tax=Roseomonas nitratireducens TaxID=2820810 RepID=A0ABS4AMW2_9PROT|nr:peptidoglycan editing factor PgeF [Neoroseomonas nitratireducens]MBP0462681.1 peptidoglycan editing factor PgeF [Neoroseomonas nitratireducens]
MAVFVTAGTLARAGLPHGFFTRRGGVSSGAFAALNCSLSGKDDADAVAENRRRAADALGVPGDALAALTQVHGPDVAVLDAPWPLDARPKADAMVTRRPGVALGIVTADCAPVLFADAGAGVIGAAHAGWRGAVAGVLEATIDAMVALGARRASIVTAVGPCIRQPSYEVAADLRDAVLARDAADARFFAPGRREDRWQFDLAGYCAARLSAASVAVEVTPHDTLAAEADFFSHRRNTLAGGGPIGHQLSAIALPA